MGNENVERLTIAIDAKEFAYQGPRFEWLGPNSGESFKKNKLIPFLNNLDDGEQGVIDFTGTMIYSPSFLEESFGGAVREGHADKIKNLKFENIPDEWRKALESYISEAVKNARK